MAQCGDHSVRVESLGFSPVTEYNTEVAVIALCSIREFVVQWLLHRMTNSRQF